MQHNTMTTRMYFSASETKTFYAANQEKRISTYMHVVNSRKNTTISRISGSYIFSGLSAAGSVYKFILFRYQFHVSTISCKYHENISFLEDAKKNAA